MKLAATKSMAASSSRVDFTPLRFTSRAIRYEIPALLTNTEVKSLHLPVDRLDEDSSKCIIMMLKQHDFGPRVEEIHLSRIPDENSHHDRRHRASLVRIVLSLKHSAQLKKLVISETSLNDNEISAVASMLYDSKSLRSLVLRQCDIDHRSASTIACALTKNTALESCDFSNNPIGDAGVSALAVLLERNASVKKMKLSGTRLGPKGAAAIAPAISSDSHLEVLDLSRNSIGDVGSGKIAVALKSNKKMRQLSLRQNDLSDVGGLCLLLSLYDGNNLPSIVDSNHTLHHLILSHNKVGRKCLRDIERVRSMNLLESERETIRQKVAFFLTDRARASGFGGDVMTKMPTLARCMPDLLAVVANTEHITALYHLVKAVDPSILFEPKNSRTRA